MLIRLITITFTMMLSSAAVAEQEVKEPFLSGPSKAEPSNAEAVRAQDALMIKNMLAEQGYNDVTISYSSAIDGYQVDYSNSAIKPYIIELRPPKKGLRGLTSNGHSKSSLQAYQQHQVEVIQEFQAMRLLKRVKSTYTRSIYALAVDATHEQAEKLRAHESVTAVHDDVLVRSSLDESTRVINAPAAWNGYEGQIDALSGQGVKVAILDTGIDYTHEALGGCFGEGCKVVDGYDFHYEDADPMDVDGHGTHVAGIVAANSSELKGVAPDALLYAYKVLGDEGFGWTSKIILGIERAMDPDQDPSTDDAVDVMNLSLSGPGDANSLLSQAADRAVEAGIVMVVAAGNSYNYGEITKASPASSRLSITVASSDNNDRASSFTSKGSPDLPGAFKPEIIAPGSSITSSYVDNSTAALSGTSMAAPHVAGAAALLIQAFPDDTPDRIKRRLTSTSKDIGLDPFVQGSGRLDLSDILQRNLSASKGAFLFGALDKRQARFSDTQSITLYNDSAQDMELDVTVDEAFSAPISLSFSDSRIQIPANGQATFSVSLSVDAPSKLALPDNAISSYLAKVSVSSSTETLQFPVALSNSNILTLSNRSSIESEVTLNFEGQGLSSIRVTVPANGSEQVRAPSGKASILYTFSYPGEDALRLKLPSDANVFEVSQANLNINGDMDFELVGVDQPWVYGLSPQYIETVGLGKDEFFRQVLSLDYGNSLTYYSGRSVSTPTYYVINQISPDVSVKMAFPQIHASDSGNELTQFSLNPVVHSEFNESTNFIDPIDKHATALVVDFSSPNVSNNDSPQRLQAHAWVSDYVAVPLGQINGDRVEMIETQHYESGLAVTFANRVGGSEQQTARTGFISFNKQHGPVILNQDLSLQALIPKGQALAVGQGTYFAQSVSQWDDTLYIHGSNYGSDGHEVVSDTFGSILQNNKDVVLELFCDQQSVFKGKLPLPYDFSLSEWAPSCAPVTLHQSFSSRLGNIAASSTYRSLDSERDNGDVVHSNSIERILLTSGDTPMATSTLDKILPGLRIERNFLDKYSPIAVSVKLNDGEWRLLETLNVSDNQDNENQENENQNSSDKLSGGYVYVALPFFEGKQAASIKIEEYDGVYEFTNFFMLGFDESSDIDNDGLANVNDPDDDNDGVPDSEDFSPFDPEEAYDTDGDGIGNKLDEDDDNDGVLDIHDDFPTDARYTTDSDKDGLADELEAQYGTDPQNADSDGDLLADGEEVTIGTSPLLMDSDGDKISDFDEWSRGANPLLRLNRMNIDFDNDGRDDFTIRRLSNRHTYIRLSSGTKNRSDNFGQQAADIPLYGEFDGDGITDLVIRRPSNGHFYVKKSRSGKVASRSFGRLASDIPVLADYDGDGKTDLAIRRPQTGMWYVLQSSSGKTYQKKFGIKSTDIAVPADYDGDGRADIAIRRPSTGEFIILHSSDNQTHKIRFGRLPSDKAVVGDYDGDGISDLAIFRESASEYRWFIRHSSSMEIHSVSIENFGASYIPLTGDFDGDGINDIAFRDINSGMHYYMSSMDEGLKTVNFGKDASDIPFSTDAQTKMSLIAKPSKPSAAGEAQLRAELDVQAPPIMIKQSRFLDFEADHYGL
ncbi:S8 family serine peptidase [Glaciecola siphonariae]|uniref:S8 family serine peptidase n=1 Tax=Glaciecola siphonariae TaxID=521012 RepID=A0ABV9LU01_9ALTE